MPWLSGKQMLEEIFKTHPDVKCIITTGDPTTTDAITMESYDNCHILKKPYRAKKLIALVDEKLSLETPQSS